jgi:hypothetical protein
VLSVWWNPNRENAEARQGGVISALEKVHVPLFRTYAAG